MKIIFVNFEIRKIIVEDVPRLHVNIEENDCTGDLEKKKLFENVPHNVFRRYRG